MHSGSIHNNTQAGRLFRLMSDNPGRWYTSMEIIQELFITAPPTVISQVREQLRGNDRYRLEQAPAAHGKGNKYRIVEVRPAVPQQLSLV